MSLSIHAQQALLNSYHGKVSNFGALAAAPQLFIGLHAATTLTAQAAAAQKIIVTTHTMSVGAPVVVGLGLGTEENHVVAGVTGAGPFNVTLVDNLASIHNAAEEVKFQPAEDGSDIIEPGEASYARVATLPVDWNLATAAEPSVTSNANAITMPVSLQDWAGGSTLTHALEHDAVAAGNFLNAGPLAVPKKSLVDDQLTFAPGTMQKTFA